jgi:hypothetical protein
MPFHYPEQQDETMMPERKFPAGTQAGVGQSASVPDLPIRWVRSWQRPQPDLQSAPQGIGHRILQIGLGEPNSSSAAFTPWKSAKPEIPSKIGIGHRILGLISEQSGLSGRVRQNAKLQDWSSRPVPLPYLKPYLAEPPTLLSNTASPKAGLNDGQQQGIFSSFVPVGANLNGGGEPTNNQKGFVGVDHMPQGLGQSENNFHPQIVTVRKAPSPIKQVKPVPEVKPELRKVQNSPKQHKLKMNSLMQGIHERPVPGAVRHLTQDDERRVANEAYGETARGSVAEHEAIISVILNRVRSGDRQYVDRGQEFTVPNVIAAHTRRGTRQFQALDNDAYAQFGQANDQGTRNARTAAGNIAAHGPTNRATHFIVTPPNVQPTPRQVAALGHVKPAGNVGNVYLYEDLPRTPHKVAGHQHHRGSQQQRNPNRR